VVFLKEKPCCSRKLRSPLHSFLLAQLPQLSHAGPMKSGFASNKAMKLSALASGGFDSSRQFNWGYCEWQSLKRLDKRHSRRDMPLPIASCQGWHAAPK
jgi:hypothetical protein